MPPINTKTNSGSIDILPANLGNAGKVFGIGSNGVPSLLDVYTPKNTKTYYVATTGSDTNNGLSKDTAFLTLTKALSVVGNSGNQIQVMPGTYTEDFTISALNVSIVSANLETGGLCNFTGTGTVSSASSSVRLTGLTFANLIHSGNCSLYMFFCRINTAFTKTSTGYGFNFSCDFQGASLTTTISITSASLTNFTGASNIGALTLNNASANVLLKDNAVSSPLVLQAGTLAVNNTPVYSATGTSNAITVTGATSVLILNNTRILTPTNTQARISIGSGSFYQISNGVSYDKTNSTLSGTNLADLSYFDAINVTSYYSDSFTASTLLETDSNKKIVSSTINLAELKKINVVGNSLSSASTVNLNNSTGETIDITGTTTITTLTLSAGLKRIVRFTGALTLTNGANLILPTGANITTAAGDYAVFIGYASSVVRCVSYTRANGTALAGGSGAVSSVNTKTGDVVLNQDDILDGTTYKQYSGTEKTKLAGIQTGATANQTDSYLLSRTNHTGTQTASTISDFQATVSANTDVSANTSARHTHSNKSILDATQESFTTILKGNYDTAYTHSQITSGNPHGVTKTDVGLGSVTNDAQTKASIVPNALPSSGQILIGNAGGTAYAKQSVSGDGTLSNAGVLTVTKTSGTSFGTAATLNVGTSANQIIQLDSNAKLPAVDGSQLTNVVASGNAPSLAYSVLSAGLDGNRRFNFITQASTTSLSFSASTPIKSCYPSGTIETISTNPTTITGLNTSAIYYVVKELGNQPIATTLKPIESVLQPSSPATGQYWLDTATIPAIGKKWNGSAWVNTDFVRWGQCLMNSANTAITYTPYFETTQATLTVGTPFTVNNNTGTQEVMRFIDLECTSAGNGYAVGDRIRYWDGNSGSGSSAFGLIEVVNADGITTTIIVSGNAGIIGIVSKTTGNLINGAAASFKGTIRIKRFLQFGN